MAKNTYFERDHGWDKLVTSFKAAEGEETAFVGFLKSSGLYKPKAKKGKAGPAPSITIAQIAAINEFGTADGRVPERSFIRSALSKYGKAIERLAQKLARQVVEGEIEKKKALGALAEFTKGKIQHRIGENVPPSNKPATIKVKGSSHTLIDTGQLRDSVAWEIKGGSK